MPNNNLNPFAGLTHNNHTFLNTIDTDDAILVQQEPKEEEIKEIIKKRHLSQGERNQFHKPKSDWVEGNGGEECRNANTLCVKDLLEKFNVK